MLRFAIIVCLFSVTACSGSSPPKIFVNEVAGSGTERITSISTILTKHKAPPTAILDAHFIEEQIGDGFLGPSDFRAFYSIEVAPQNVLRWTQVLTPLSAIAEYDSPIQPRDWWIARESFASLQFYKPDILTGRVHGWIGVSQETGRIYIFTFTM
jgi:hypothetical protein